jgi:hypothetical protein
VGENGWEKFYKIVSSSSEVVEQLDRDADPAKKIKYEC